MDFEISDEQRALIDSTRALLAGKASMEATRALADEGVEFDRELWRVGAELGWPALAIAEDDGGLGQRVIDLALVAIELGRTLAKTPFIPTVVVADAVAKSDLNNRADLLDAFLSGSASACWGFAEYGRAWTVGAIACRAEKHADGYLLNGMKVDVQDAASARWMLIDAVLQGEPARFLIPADSVGLEVTAQKTLDVTRAYCDLKLNNVVASHDALCCLGSPAQTSIAGSLHLSTVLSCAELVGVGRELLDMTVDHVKKRQQFGQPVGSFQAVKHKCANMSIWLQATTAATYFAAMALDTDGADRARAVSVAKSYASDSINQLAGEALQLHGGIGFTWEHDLHLYLRRARANSLIFGDATYHREFLCAHLESSAAAEAPPVAAHCQASEA